MSRFVQVAMVGELQPGGKKRVVLGQEEVLVVNLDGRMVAVQDRCGHMSVSLSGGELEGSVVTCPFHSGRFDLLTGQVVQEANAEALNKRFESMGLPPVVTQPLRVYEVRVEGEKVLIKV